MDTLPAPGDAAPLPNQDEGGDAPGDGSTGLEAPEPPEVSDASGSGGEGGDWLLGSDEPELAGPSMPDEFPVAKHHSGPNLPARVPKTVELVPADGGWRSGRKRR
ncbi:MAG TPA: hypothetical protein VFI31_09605 [Pirellulales bacterium]|nr:hypothetical protein [Pirellulales bacterium]